MKKRSPDYMQISLRGIAIASLGTLSIFEPEMETVLYDGMRLILGLGMAMINRG